MWLDEGSTGPKEICEGTGKPYGLSFKITIKDMVKAQACLLDHLGIKKTLAVLGGSMGGMQALQFCSLYPDKTFTLYRLLALQVTLRKILF